MKQEIFTRGANLRAFEHLLGVCFRLRLISGHTANWMFDVAYERFLNAGFSG